MIIEKAISGIDEQYIEEAADISTAFRAYKGRCVKRTLFTAAAALFCIALIAILTQHILPADVNNMIDDSVNRESSATGGQSTAPTENVIETPIKVSLSTGEQSASYVNMNVNCAVNVKNVYAPQTADRYDGLKFQVDYEGCRIDVMTEKGKLTPDNPDTSHIYDGVNEASNNLLYCFDYNSISVSWRPYGVDNFWEQENTVRVYAVRNNTIFMYAVLHISSEDKENFVAEITYYEDFSESGGVKVTEDNRGEFYPLAETPFQTCDMNQVLNGQKPDYYTLNEMQPVSMDIYEWPQDIVYDDIRNRMPYGIPLKAEISGMSFWGPNSDFIKYDLDLALKTDDLYHHLVDTKCEYYGPIEDTAINGFLVPSKGKRYPQMSHTGNGQDFNVAVINPTDGRIYGLVNIVVYRYISDDICESIILATKYEDYTSCGGKVYTNDMVEQFPHQDKADAENRAERIVDMLEQADRETIQRLGFDESALEGFRTNWSENTLKETINFNIELYPFADDMTIARLVSAESMGIPGYFEVTYPRYKAEILGELTEDSPHITPDQASDILTKYVRYFRNGEFINGDTYPREGHFILFDDIIVAELDEISPPDFHTSDGMMRNSIGPPPKSIYELSDGSRLSCELTSGYIRGEEHPELPDEFTRSFSLTFKYCPAGSDDFELVWSFELIEATEKQIEYDYEFNPDDWIFCYDEGYCSCNDSGSVVFQK